MFHAVRALLATKRLDSRKHSGVISLFNQHFVKPGLVSCDLVEEIKGILTGQWETLAGEGDTREDPSEQ